jgi:hypothetical protein
MDQQGPDAYADFGDRYSADDEDAADDEDDGDSLDDEDIDDEDPYPSMSRTAGD